MRLRRGIAMALVAWAAVAAEASPVARIRVYVEPGLGAAWAGAQVRADVAAWLEGQVPGWTVVVEPPELSPRTARIRADGDAVRLVTVSRPDPGAARTIDVHYVAEFADRVRGRTWTTTDGRALVVLPASSLASHASPAGARQRERRVLRHELVHAMGWMPAADHREDRGGPHCLDARCLMHQGPTLLDLLASVFAPFTRHQAHELCSRCREEMRVIASRG